MLKQLGIPESKIHFESFASAQEAAASTIEKFEVLHLRDKAREVFMNAILNPPAPDAAARAAAERYRKHVDL